MKNIPNEIKFNICLFLDTRSLCNLSSVSKDWKLLSEDDQIWNEKLSKITQYQDKTRSSKSIFAQIATLKRKDHNDLLTFAVTYPQIAKLILQTPELLDQMNVNGLFIRRNIVILAQSHLETAKFIFQDPRFALYIDTRDLFKIAQRNSELAKLVLQNYVFAYDKCKYDLLNIAEMYPEAKNIISMKYPQSNYMTPKEKIINQTINAFCKIYPDQDEMVREYCRKFAP